MTLFDLHVASPVFIGPLITQDPYQWGRICLFLEYLVALRLLWSHTTASLPFILKQSSLSF
jgi:hypothetical protein